MKNKKMFATIYFVLGIVLLYLAKFVFTQSYLRGVQGICIGVGAIIFIYGMISLGKIFTNKNLESEEFVRDKEILVNDERNIFIKEKAGYMTVKTMNVIFFIFIILFSILTKEKLDLVLLAALILVQGSLFIGYSIYYSKRF